MANPHVRYHRGSYHNTRLWIDQATAPLVELVGILAL